MDSEPKFDNVDFDQHVLDYSFEVEQRLAQESFVVARTYYGENALEKCKDTFRNSISKNQEFKITKKKDGNNNEVSLWKKQINI